MGKGKGWSYILLVVFQEKDTAMSYIKQSITHRQFCCWQEGADHKGQVSHCPLENPESEEEYKEVCVTEEWKIESSAYCCVNQTVKLRSFLCFTISDPVITYQSQ